MRWSVLTLAALTSGNMLMGCPGPDTGVGGGVAEIPDDADGDGVTAADGDCDDRNAAIYPGAAETWYDGVDQDCAGGDDYDRDGDGVEAGAFGADCNDSDAAIFPGALEACNGADDDCDDVIDEDPADALPYYADADGDGVGSGSSLGTACEPAPGYASVAGDCDDNNSAISPSSPETCNGIDDDCSGFADDDALDGVVWYADVDGDGYGEAAAATLWCEQPDGYVADSTDCDDADPLAFPDAAEMCDGADNDCDGAVDDAAIDPSMWYADADSDTFGDATVFEVACDVPSGYVADATDCNDADAALSPGAYEACDGIDNNCNGEVDTDSPAAARWYPDGDLDGYGDAAAGVTACTQPAGTIVDGGDCDDADAEILPGATEFCDGVDNNCDGTTDEATAVDVSTFYVDADLDGYGDPSGTIAACSAPAGYAATDDDCDDAEATANPGNRESCDGLDNDCDAEVDEDDATDAVVWHADVDSDGYGDAASTTTACAAPSGFLADDADCDDTEPLVNPLGTETQDLSDEDCDGLVDEDFVSAGDVIVTEVARQPYAGGSGTATNSDAQWFELYNTTSTTLDISNWYFEEQDGDSFYASPDAALQIPPGGYLVLCYDTIGFGTASTCDYNWGNTDWGPPNYDVTFYFDRDEDLIALYVAGALMDEVHWIYDATLATWPRTAHYSMELDNNALNDADNDAYASWCKASIADKYISSGVGAPDYGTPGAANGSCD